MTTMVHMVVPIVFSTSSVALVDMCVRFIVISRFAIIKIYYIVWGLCYSCYRVYIGLSNMLLMMFK